MRRKRAPSEGEETFALHCKVYQVPVQREFRIPGRQFRYDFMVPVEGHAGIVVEIHGGLFVNGGHSRGAAFERDLEKQHRALLHGYLFVAFSTGQVRSASAIDTVIKLKGMLEK